MIVFPRAARPTVVCVLDLGLPFFPVATAGLQPRKGSSVSAELSVPLLPSQLAQRLTTRVIQQARPFI